MDFFSDVLSKTSEPRYRMLEIRAIRQNPIELWRRIIGVVLLMGGLRMVFYMNISGGGLLLIFGTVFWLQDILPNRAQPPIEAIPLENRIGPTGNLRARSPGSELDLD
eukprot:NODE_541_length_6250_cov_0.390831.p4 type:complete len:108 gc:universal NODE_541_length_6250_cov_0.390831:461-784(+)